MSEEPVNLQFDRAEYTSAAPQNQNCAACHNAITDEYYASGQAVLCSGCTAQIRKKVGGAPTGSEFMMALLWGLGGAAVGCLINAIVLSFGIQLSLISIFVGYLVGRGVHRGCRGKGGLAMQILAVVLTYCAICGSFVPVAMSSIIKKSEARLSPGDPAKHLSVFGIVATSVVVFGYALASPALNGFDPLGWIILAFGLWQGWRMNRAPVLLLSGPFSKESPAPALL